MKFKAEISRIGAARANVGNAISYAQTQDGFLSTVDSALRRMSELATLANDQTKSSDDLSNYNLEFAELKSFVKATAAKETALKAAKVTADEKNPPGKRSSKILKSVTKPLSGVAKALGKVLGGLFD